ncbi:MAG: hypothetical protein ACTSW1_16355 [Candidatus Hodarchaeales archaeon]
MFGLDIISKPGFLLFSHEFVKGWLYEVNLRARDKDIHASLICAALNTLKETQGETITVIRHVGFTLLLYEGILTYGILTTSEAEYDPKQYEFLKNIVLKFELMFTFELTTTTLFSRDDFKIFRSVVSEMYEQMVGIDVDGLRKILKAVSRSKVRNFIVYEKNYFQPVFTSIVEPDVNLPLHKLTKIFRELNYVIEQEYFEETPSCTCEINIDNVLITGIRVPTHWLILLSDVSKGKSSILHDIKKINDNLSNDSAMLVT